MAGLSKSEVCVIIPAYNEEKNIVRVACGARDRGFAVWVVDDGSKDKTAQAVRTLAGVGLFCRPMNEGKGAAVRSGFEHFLQSPYRALILMDADGQHDPEDLDFFLKALSEKKAALVIGNRLSNPQGMPWVRRLTNRFMSWLISLISGQTIPDSQCGFRALRRELVEKINWETTRFEIESEIILKAARTGFVIESIPIRCVYKGEESQIRPLRDTFRFVRFVFGYFFKRKT